MKISTFLCGVASLASAGLLSVPVAHAATPAELLAAYSSQARATPSAERGQKLFTADFGRPMGFRCASCHGPVPTGRGKDEVSEKPIAPLAPAANAARFTDKSKVENAFRMNCKDVVGRECTALEKADVMTWLISLKP
jgi:hypothetical protein